MVRRRKPVDDCGTVPPPLPPPMFEQEDYRTPDGAMAMRWVMLPNRYPKGTPATERTA